MKLSLAAALDGIDALLTPTTMRAALPVHEVDQTSAPAHYTRFGNFLDLCAFSLPNGFARDGLPISLQMPLLRRGNRAVRTKWHDRP